MYWHYRWSLNIKRNCHLGDGRFSWEIGHSFHREGQKEFPPFGKLFLYHPVGTLVGIRIDRFQKFKFIETTQFCVEICAD